MNHSRDIMLNVGDAALAITDERLFENEFRYLKISKFSGDVQGYKNSTTNLRNYFFGKVKRKTPYEGTLSKFEGRAVPCVCSSVRKQALALEFPMSAYVESYREFINSEESAHRDWNVKDIRYFLCFLSDYPIGATLFVISVLFILVSMFTSAYLFSGCVIFSWVVYLFCVCLDNWIICDFSAKYSERQLKDIFLFRKLFIKSFSEEEINKDPLLSNLAVIVDKAEREGNSIDRANKVLQEKGKDLDRGESDSNERIDQLEEKRKLEEEKRKLEKEKDDLLKANLSMQGLLDSKDRELKEYSVSDEKGDQKNSDSMLIFMLCMIASEWKPQNIEKRNGSIAYANIFSEVREGLNSVSVALSNKEFGRLGFSESSIKSRINKAILYASERGLFDRVDFESVGKSYKLGFKEVANKKQNKKNSDE